MAKKSDNYGIPELYVVYKFQDRINSENSFFMVVDDIPPMRRYFNLRVDGSVMDVYYARDFAKGITKRKRRKATAPERKKFMAKFYGKKRSMYYRKS